MNHEPRTNNFPMDFLTDFGVKPVLLAAQVVNFFILLFLLKKFLYKPILKVLEDRKVKIAESIKNADEIETRLQKIASEQEKRINEANVESQKIIDEATKSASHIIDQAHKKASEDITKMVKKAEDNMSLERAKLHQEIKSELADLVAIGLQKVVDLSLNEKEKKELVQKSLKNLT